jgi:large subunit ribosomal protein L30
MAKIRIKQEKSAIHTTLRQKRTLEALGFSRMNQVLEVEATPQINGMIEKVKHLVAVVA